MIEGDLIVASSDKKYLIWLNMAKINGKWYLVEMKWKGKVG